jgi:hypothetical protein
MRPVGVTTYGRTAATSDEFPVANGCVSLADVNGCKSSRERAVSSWATRAVREDGSILVLTALAVVILLGMTALAVDASYMFDYRNKMAAAADAAALAGAYEIKRNPDIDKTDPLPLRYLVQKEASNNGFTNGSSGVSVTVNHPPTSGTFVGNTKYVEVIVRRAATPTFFARVLNRSSMNVGARAVAGLRENGLGCIYALSTDAGSAFGTSGTGTLNVSDCTIYDASSNSSAFSVGSGWTVTAKAINVVGGWNINASANVTPNPPTRVVRVDDPLAFMNATPPPIGATCDAAHTNADYNGVTVTINPGTYCGGLTVRGTSVVSLSPGIYVMKNEALTVSDTATIKNVNSTDNGVTFYFAGTTIKPSSFTQDTHIYLHATKTGTWAGILFYNPLIKNSASNIFDSNDQVVEGVAYFSGQHLEWKGTGGASSMILIADTLKFTGQSHLTSGFFSLGGGGAAGGTAALGE